MVVGGGTVVVSPAGEAHGFVNSGTGELRLTAIHGAGRFTTEWLEGDDPTWASKRG
jgi:mannose-6-phosphate isomerase-like protein (cupin superfamily)